jgi:hypothetical protein
VFVIKHGEVDPLQILWFFVFVVLAVLFLLAVGYGLSWLEKRDDEADT